ncbi:MAG: ATPase, T2SS/T4P/T4SS family [Erysipelotrichaceae bacterium]
METLLQQLLTSAIQAQVSDIHIKVEREYLQLSMRGLQGMSQVEQPYPLALLHYLKYIADLDMGCRFRPQNGQFSMEIANQRVYFRLSVLATLTQESAVLRILNKNNLSLADLTSDTMVQYYFRGWCQQKSGMVLFSGPTGSGKTTTIHTLLDYIAQQHAYKVITLEDPIEMHNETLTQLQVNEAIGFTYEQGIKEVLRHDPDVLMIGEIRDEASAQAAIRAALSGHMVYACIHAKNSLDVLLRMQQFGVHEQELLQVLSGVSNQRLVTKKAGKERLCLYEILSKADIQAVLQHQGLPCDHQSMEQQLQQAFAMGEISEATYQSNCELF